MTELDRKELKRPDLFQAKMNKVFLWLRERVRVLIAIGVAAFGVVVAAILVQNYLDAKNEKAMAAFYEAEVALEKALTPPPKEESSKKVAKKETLDSDWEQKAKPSIERLESVAKNHAKSFAAFKAMMTLGQLYFEKKNLTKAAEYFEMAKDAKGSMRGFALHSLAYAFENSNNLDKAISTHESIVNDKNLKTFHEDSLFALVRLYGEKGNSEKSGQFKSLLLKDYPNSPNSKKVQQ